MGSLLLKKIKTIVNIFFGLPSSLSAAIICDWLNLKSACRLDSATCAQKKRAVCGVRWASPCEQQHTITMDKQETNLLLVAISFKQVGRR